MNDEWTLKEAETEAETVEVRLSTDGARHVPAAEVAARLEQPSHETLALWATSPPPVGTQSTDPALTLADLQKAHAAVFPCPAETRAKRNFVNHTHRCQFAAGHERRHEWSDGAGRTVIWYGEARKVEGDMRYRFGLDPHWMMKTPGRKVMAGDFDSEW